LLKDSLQQELAEGYVKIGDVEGNPFVSNLGDITKALESYRKALSLGTAVLARKPKDLNALKEVARIHQKLGSVLPFDGKGKEALSETNEAVRLYQQVLAATPDDVQAKVDLSSAYEAQGDVVGGARAINLGRKDEAAVAYRHGLDLLPDLPSTHTLAPRVARGRLIFNMKITDLTAYGNPSGALTQYKDEYAEAQRIANANPADAFSRSVAAILLEKVATMQGLVGDLKGALDTYRKGIEPAEEALRADPTNGKAQYNMMVGYKNLGDLYYNDLHNMPEALKCFERATELLEKLIQADPKNVVNRQGLADTLSYLASSELATGKSSEGRRDAKRALQIGKEIADSPNANPDQLYNYAWLAVTVDPADLRDFKGALPYAKRAAEERGGNNALSLHVLAQAYAGSGDYAHAEETEQKAVASYAPLKPGDPVPIQQKMMEDFLKEIRAELKKHPAILK
jgi:tetratricopeptide (TPR) repeat protein